MHVGAGQVASISKSEISRSRENCRRDRSHGTARDKASSTVQDHLVCFAPNRFSQSWWNLGNKWSHFRTDAEVLGLSDHHEAVRRERNSLHAYQIPVHHRFRYSTLAQGLPQAVSWHPEGPEADRLQTAEACCGFIDHSDV